MISGISVVTAFVFGFVLSLEFGPIKKRGIRAEVTFAPIIHHCDFAIRCNSSMCAGLSRQPHFHRRITRQSTPKHVLRRSASEIDAVLSHDGEDQNISAQTRSTCWRLTGKHCRLIPLCSYGRSRTEWESAGSLAQGQNLAYHKGIQTERRIWYEKVVIKWNAWFEQRWRSTSDWKKIWSAASIGDKRCDMANNQRTCLKISSFIWSGVPGWTVVGVLEEFGCLNDS
jgi:hypothetical protein